MNRAYAWLGAAVIALALVSTLVARAPRRGPATATPAPPAPLSAIALVVDDGRVTPARVAVPKGHRVALSVVNASRAPVDLALAGYEERVRRAGIAPGATWRVEFVADLPGEDFAWLVNGQPAGQLSVTGSHLVEGHR